MIACVIYVTRFAKRGLIHASSFLILRICNSACIGSVYSFETWEQDCPIILLKGQKISA